MSTHGQTNDDRRLNREAKAKAARAVSAAQPRRRRTLTGVTVLVAGSPVQGWKIAAALPFGWSGYRAAVDPDHPSRKHDPVIVRSFTITPPSMVSTGYPPGVRRRVRRAAVKQALANAMAAGR